MKEKEIEAGVLYLRDRFGEDWFYKVNEAMFSMLYRDYCLIGQLSIIKNVPVTFDKSRGFYDDDPKVRRMLTSLWTLKIMELRRLHPPSIAV